MTRYELLYIIPATLTDEEVGGVETRVAAVMAKVGATVESTKRLGKFRFAYPIKNQRHGHYVMVMLSAEPAMVAKLDENLKLLNDVLRHLLLRADEAGSDQKFDLIQFTEVNVDQDRPKRREKSGDEKPGKDQEEMKAGVAALEKKEDEKEEVKEEKSDVSTEDLDKKIELALSDDTKGV